MVRFTGSYKSPKICVISPNMQKYGTEKALFRPAFMECVLNTNQQILTCSMSEIGTIEKSVKCVQS